MADSPSATPGPKPGKQLDSTTVLLAGARAGDAAAREALVARFLAPLRRFAHGRLPARARGMLDTDDLVQVTLEKALKRVDSFEPRAEGSFLAYLRQILVNQIRDEIRRADARPPQVALDDDLPARDRSPVEQAIGAETVEAYERALAALPDEQQAAIMLRIELGFTYQEVAEAIGKPTANAARMMITRALVQLADGMRARGAGR
jgi:RNA polymerase sigma-70 factor (ECF subfamily)